MRTLARVALLSAFVAPSLQAQSVVSQLSWMSGCWERRANGRVIEEMWLPARGGVLFGIGRTFNGDSLVTWEQMRIRASGDTLIYHATPAGQAPAEFRALVTPARTVSFENPAHDFPQRVMYRAVGGDSLIARIEGTRNGQQRAIDYPYRRVSCATAQRAPEFIADVGGRPDRPFSPAVRANGFLFLAGQIGTDSTGAKVVAGGIQAETRQAMENIRTVLARNGSSFDRVVKCTVFLADMKEWGAMNEVYVTYFNKARRPARSAMGTSGLALDARVEIECLAVDG